MNLSIPGRMQGVTVCSGWSGWGRKSTQLAAALCKSLRQLGGLEAGGQRPGNLGHVEVEVCGHKKICLFIQRGWETLEVLCVSVCVYVSVGLCVGDLGFLGWIPSPKFLFVPFLWTSFQIAPQPCRDAPPGVQALLTPDHSRPEPQQVGLASSRGTVLGHGAPTRPCQAPLC
jgi:hypothetical protein